MKKFRNFLIAGLLSLSLFSCGNKSISYEQMTPEQQAKEYAQFQKDSLRACTEQKVNAISAVKGAFDRIPENNGFWKRDNINLNYNDSLKCWVGVVDYHVDRNGTYYQASKTFYIKYWAVNMGLAKDMEVFYTITEEK